jgi:F420-non-reducing hydrogenase iron-sulfur subunit
MKVRFFLTLIRVSSAEAPRFAEVVSRFTKQIRSLGPNPARKVRAATPAANPKATVDEGRVHTS